MLNHNIINIILDKMAFNQWNNIIKLCNQEYHSLFEINKLFMGVSTRSCKHITGIKIYNYRISPAPYNSTIGRGIIKKCDKCQKNYFSVKSICSAKLPHNYWK